MLLFQSFAIEKRVNENGEEWWINNFSVVKSTLKLVSLLSSIHNWNMQTIAQNLFVSSCFSEMNCSTWSTFNRRKTFPESLGWNISHLFLIHLFSIRIIKDAILNIFWVFAFAVVYNVHLISFSSFMARHIAKTNKSWEII